MTLRYRITSIRDQRDQEVCMLPTGITCIVGANNAGKSQLLKDLVEYAKHMDAANLVVLADVTHELRVAAGADTQSWLERNAHPVEPLSTPKTYELLPSQSMVDAVSFDRYVRDVALGKHGLDHLHEAFIRRISAGSLSSYAAGHLRTDAFQDQNSNWLLQKLIPDGELERELSALVSELFATPIFMDRQHFPPRLRAGEVGMPAPAADAITAEYSRAVEDVAALDEQGDGLRSFAGLALVVLALSPEVLLLDEPESFLHPGQARAVGRWLAEVATSRDMQVVVATHDRDFLVGLLSASDDSSVEVFRVARDTTGSELHTITADRLNQYWADPVLRFSNALQGLFHKRVVVCEGDADCRFYSAVAEVLAADIDARHVADDTLFVPSGGKNGMAKMLGVLSDLGVQASVIADFDILNSKSTVKSIVGSLGAEWSEELENAYESAERQIGANLDAFWKSAKNGGMASVPRGQLTQTFRRMIELLGLARLHIVEEGELEDFYRDEGKGSGWISMALANDAHLGSAPRALLTKAIPELDSNSA